MRKRFLVLAAFLRKGHVAFHSRLGGGVRAWLALLALASVFGPAPVAGALTLELDGEYSGGETPGGTLTASFENSVDPNHVQLTLSSNLVGSEIVGSWLFNLDSALDPTQLVFEPVDIAASVPNSIDKGSDAFMAAGGGLFDIRFDFPPPPGHDTDAFSFGETLVYDISYVGVGGPFTASSFDVLSAPGGGNGTYASAAHIMRIGPQADGSGWIGDATVPEPSTALLLGAGLAGLATVGRRNR